MEKSKTKWFSRRDFLRVSSAVTLTSGVPVAIGEAAPKLPGGGYKGVLCLFSIPVPEMNWRQLAQSARSAGFGGIDLTVRKGGHVLPEKVARDLPKAVAEIRAEGLRRSEDNH